MIPSARSRQSPPRARRLLPGFLPRRQRCSSTWLPLFPIPSGSRTVQQNPTGEFHHPHIQRDDAGRDEGRIERKIAEAIRYVLID